MVKWFIAWAGIGYLVWWKWSTIFYRISPRGKRRDYAATKRQGGSAPALRPREQLRAFARRPIHQQPDPFAHRGVGAAQAGGERLERHCEVDRPTRAPVDRIGFDRKSGATEH